MNDNIKIVMRDNGNAIYCDKYEQTRDGVFVTRTKDIIFIPHSNISYIERKRWKKQ